MPRVVKKQTQEVAPFRPPFLREVVRPQNRESFSEVSERLAEALADCYDNVSCPEFIRAAIEKFHASIATEFNIEVAADIRLRFAIAAQLSKIGDRPA